MRRAEAIGAICQMRSARLPTNDRGFWRQLSVAGVWMEAVILTVFDRADDGGAVGRLGAARFGGLPGECRVGAFGRVRRVRGGLRRHQGVVWCERDFGDGRRADARWAWAFRCAPEWEAGMHRATRVVEIASF